MILPMTVRSLLRLLLVVAAFFTSSLAVSAQELGPVRARMQQRLPQIDALKSSGAVGEDNRGYLAVREAKDNAEQVVSAENNDRRAVYEAIAKKAGSSADAVGRQRAQHIASQSAPGVWLQRADGTWYRK